MHLSRVAVGLLATIGLTTLGLAQTSTPKPLPISEATKTTTRASNEFACNLYRQLASDKPDANAFVSPWSISSALAMTLEGARGDCAAEMGLVLGLPKELRQAGDRPWRLDSYHEGFADLQRRCTPPRDLVKDAATRAKIAELRRELTALNQRLAKNFSPALDKTARSLATTINQLQQQIDLFELNVANAIWGEKTYPFDPAYADSVGRYYGTGLVREADFLNNFPTERAKINRWVEDQTKEKIKNLIPEIPPEQARLIRMILVNAIYFKGQWSEPFEKKWTKDEPFLLADGTKKATPLMRQTLAGRYAAFNADGSFFETPVLVGFATKKEKLYPSSDGFVIAELPYKGNRLAMTVIAPRSPNGLQAIEKQLTGDALTRWLSRLQPRSVQVKLPKFKLETEYELGPVMEKLGMKKAFTPRVADFTGMSKSSNPDDRLYISRVIHKAFVDVNEEGTEAAAATAVIMAVPTSVPQVYPFTPEFYADRPFLVLIREVDTGAILFMGRMTTPGK